jgi:hypothetical protein
MRPFISSPTGEVVPEFMLAREKLVKIFADGYLEIISV